MLASLSCWMTVLSIGFVDVTERSGISFRHHHGGGGDKHMMETVSGGGGFFDYDGDGDLDVYLLNGAPLPGYDGAAPLTNALYRNDAGHFVDVTEASGLSEPGYSMGTVAADYDNDGDVDLYITSYGANRLYRNNGDGTFRDVTDASGTGHEGFGASAAFGDIDGDGLLDLYVTNYLDYALDDALYCGNKSEGIHTYCHPDNYDGATDVLYRNEGDGTFSDVTRSAGIDVAAGKGLGVLFTNRHDIYVANDSVMNFFFRNHGDGKFEEVGLSAGVGFSEEGRAEAGMGVDAGDYDGDGRLDLFVTNYELETNTLYRNMGDGSYLDVTNETGLGVPSLPWVGFGTGFLDADHDGDLDLFVANGHIMDHPRFLSDATSYAQPNQLFENVDGRFRDVSSHAGDYFEVRSVSRGAAFGDWDDDGDPDVLIVTNGGAPHLLENVQSTSNHWVVLRLIGASSNRDGLGARVRIDAGGRTLTDELIAGGSYLSASDLRLHFGLGAAERIERIEIVWPSGATESLVDVESDRRIVVREGLGRLAAW